MILFVDDLSFASSCIIMPLTIIMCKFHEKKWKLHAPNWRKLRQRREKNCCKLSVFSKILCFHRFIFFLGKQITGAQITHFVTCLVHLVTQKMAFGFHRFTFFYCWNVNKIASSDNETSSIINRFLFHQEILF